MNRRIPYLSYRIIVLVLLILSLTEEICSQLAYADPSLPIVADHGTYSIEVYPQRHQLVVRVKGQKFKTYTVAVGNSSTPTPVGEYQVIYKGKDWGPSFGPRWLGLNVPWGSYGIHGTNKPNSIGQHLSHGCIRMRNSDVMELFEIIPIGTKVTIYGHVLGDLRHEPRSLAEGDAGGDVQLIQSRLKSAGYFQGVCNGKFRSNTTASVKQFQRDHHLAQNGVVSIKVYEKLGLLE
ncbi:L,D-transpeptidase family protein [Paenibacillus alginolyticus]|uniref:L,D-transpeptidase family protein n=1 Tax=Paenibacillus alginolyticus TaxID=59839 RepID=A0ABT4GEX5_9BACL|nr:L,D-transpeptidase family protein [Paenibacillus alginolyticus]MCY9664185.1 L,D-transpeptidase family protein [Paenibacillus alginolyticus]MCY9694742.1 L,D-transpeptidase family protein [Paenibacillus alginolyticus]MEC0147087.1 L,D-transpeptidase family protein [Paenibacillus alginolyticus]